jgi:hypothetical protein
MSRLRIFDRNDDEFKVRLRSIRTTTIVKGIRLGRRIGQHAGRPKAVGLHLPRATHVSSAGVGIVKAKFVSAARAGGLSHYLQKDIPEQMSTYMGYVRDRCCWRIRPLVLIGRNVTCTFSSVAPPTTNLCHVAD